MPKLNTSTITNAMHGGTQLSAVYKGSVPIWIAGGALPTIESGSNAGFWKNTGRSASCVAGNRSFDGYVAYNFTSQSPATAEVYFEYYAYGAWQNRYSVWVPAGMPIDPTEAKPVFSYMAWSANTLCNPNGSKTWLEWTDPARIKIRDEHGESDWADTYTAEELEAYDEYIIGTYGSFEEYEESCNEGKIDNG